MGLGVGVGVGLGRVGEGEGWSLHDAIWLGLPIKRVSRDPSRLGLGNGNCLTRMRLLCDKERGLKKQRERG